MKPQVIVTLNPDGTLSLGLPGASGTTREVPLRPGKVAETLERVLFALALGEADIGKDGAPTVAQAKCWSSHGEWPSANCPFCRAAGRFDYKNPRKATTRVLSETRRGDVVVRKIRPGMTAKQQEAEAKRSRFSRETTSSPEDLGL